MSTRYQFVDDSGETRLAGFLEPDPGGSNPLTVIGPYRFNWNDPGIQSPGLILAALPAGSMLIKSWAIVRTLWAAGGSAGVTLGMGETADFGNTVVTLAYYNAGNTSFSPTLINIEMRPNFTDDKPYAADVIGPGVSFGVYTFGWSAGASDAYALVYTPT